MSDTTTIETRFLKNLWDDKEAAALADRPLELLRYRSNLLGADLRITNFGGGNTELEVRSPRPAYRRATACDGCEGQRRRSAIDGDLRVRRAVSGQARTSDRPLSGRSVRGRDGGALSALRVRREPRGRFHRHAASRVSSVRSCRSSPSGLGHRAGGERQRTQEAGRVQQKVRPEDHLGALAAPGIRARVDAEALGRRQPGL